MHTLKQCTQCNELKDIIQFYTRKRKNTTGTFGYCIQCTLDKSKYNQIKFKLNCLDYKKTRSCISCDYSRDISALEFHHLNSDEKDFNIAKHNRVSKLTEIIKQELDKCIVLCANCHREIHNGTIKYENNRIYISDSINKLKDWVYLKDKESKADTPCLYCNTLKSYKRQFCSSLCIGLHNTKTVLTKEELIEYLIKHKGNLSAISRELNITDNGFKKKCIKEGLNIKDYK